MFVSTITLTLGVDLDEQPFQMVVEIGQTMDIVQTRQSRDLETEAYHFLMPGHVDIFMVHHIFRIDYNVEYRECELVMCAVDFSSTVEEIHHLEKRMCMFLEIPDGT
jgi:phosphatidate phosphatase PAH1